MSNTFLAIAVPTISGVGAPTDVTLIGADKTVVADGPLVDGTVVLEGSQDGANYAPLLSIFNFADVTIPRIHAVISQIRARRVSGTGPISLSLGGEDTTANLFGVLSVPATSGAGAPFDSSLMGPDKSVCLVGSYFGSIALEGSNDGGATYDPVVSFNTLGSEKIDFLGVYQLLRVVRKGAGTVSMTVGAGSLGGGPPPYQAFIEQIGPFRQDNVPTDQSPPVPIPIGGSDIAAACAFVAMRPGEILGFAYRSNGAITSGGASAATSSVRRNGTVVGIPVQAALGPATQQSIINYVTPVPFVAGDLLDATVRTNSVYEPDQVLDHAVYILVRWAAS